MVSKYNKMVVALVLLAILSIFTIGLEFFYFTKVDNKLVGINQLKEVRVDAKDKKSEIIDLSSRLKLEYARTEAEQEKGLMNRDSLCENCGMLFIFDSSKTLSFWMKNTLIPLDIIFIAQDGTVLNIEKANPVLNAQNDTQYPSYFSNGDAKYVLEVNQNWCEKNQILNGTKIDIQKLTP